MDWNRPIQIQRAPDLLHPLLWAPLCLSRNPSHPAATRCKIRPLQTLPHLAIHFFTHLPPAPPIARSPPAAPAPPSRLATSLLLCCRRSGHLSSSSTLENPTPSYKPLSLTRSPHGGQRWLKLGPVWPITTGSHGKLRHAATAANDLFAAS